MYIYTYIHIDTIPVYIYIHTQDSLLFNPLEQFIGEKSTGPLSHTVDGSVIPAPPEMLRTLQMIR